MRVRPAPTLLALLLLSLLAPGCGSAPEPSREPELVAGNCAAWVTHNTVGQMVLVVGSRGANGQRQALAHANGLYVQLEEDRNFRVSLPFVDAESDGTTLRLTCQPHGTHTPSLSVRAAEGGGLQVVVTDVVGLQSRVRELAIDYFLDAEEPVQESWVPHLHPGPDYVAGDESWQLPLAWLRADRRALALIPDPVDREFRRLPESLRVDPELRRIRHGLTAQYHETTGQGTVLFRTHAGLAVQGESLTFRHVLKPIGDAVPDRTFDALLDAMFERWSAPQLDGPGDAKPVSWQQAAGDLVAEVTARWVPCRIAGKDLGLLTSERRGSSCRTWFTWRYQPLRTAQAMHRMAELTGDERLRDEAEKTVRGLLVAPGRGGLPPALIDFDPAAGQVSPGADDGTDRHAGWVRTLDASWTALWRLRAIGWLPELKEPLVLASRETARFLLANQQPNGSFPTFFDAEYLAPRRGVLLDDCAESAGAALFLAEFGAVESDPQALDAAARALAFLDDLSRGEHWRDFEVWTHQDSMPSDASHGASQVVGADGSLGWLFAAMAAARLAETSDAAARPAAVALSERFLYRLATFQQVRVRSWHPEDLVGGISCTNLDPTWNDARSGLAAEAFLAGYELTGNRVWLQRAALALRAVLHAPAPSSQALAAGAGAGAVSSQLIGERWGQGVVDVQGAFAQGLDAIWLSVEKADGDQLWLRCRSDAGVEQARVVFRHLGNNTGLRLRLNGAELGYLSATQLLAGINVQVEPLPRFDFLPPAEISSDQPWAVHVPCRGVDDDQCRVEVELQRGSQQPERIALALEPAELAMQPANPFVPGLPPGTQLAAQLLVRDGDSSWRVPAVGARRIVVTDHHCLDPGDDDESYLVDPGASRVALFADGREGCRELAGGDEGTEPPGMTLAVPVPAQAVRVHLDLWLCGSVRISTESRLLHADDNAPPGDRTLQLDIADRRLWPKGKLLLRLEATGGLLQVARVRYRSEGNAAEPPPPGHSRGTTPPAPSLRIALVPLQLDDLPCETTVDQLRTACFGDAEYSMTPGPKPVPTSGSVAEVLSDLSAGATLLQGDVLPHRLDVLRLCAELRGEADGGRKMLEAELLEAVRLDGIVGQLDAIVAVHGGGGRLVLPDVPARAGQPAVLFVPERNPDGTFLASGDLLYRLLRATRSLPEASSPEQGAFGAMALGGLPGNHQPAGPIALDREQLGWVDRIELDRSAELEIPTLQQDRAFLTLHCNHLAGRGDLVVEGRRGASVEAGAAALLYWEQTATPVWIATAKSCAEVRRLRLGPDPLRQPTPFVPATEHDLFTPPFVLGSSSRPCLATPQGDLPWELDVREEGNRLFARARNRTMPISNWQRAVWTTTLPDGKPTAMPIDLDLGPGGEVRTQGDDLLVRPPAQGSLRGTVTLPHLEGLTRLFAQLSVLPQAPVDALAQVRIGCGNKTLAVIDLGLQQSPGLELDLPPACEQVWFEFAAMAGTGVVVRLRQCVIVRRQPAWTVMTAPADDPATTPWMDGVVHSLGAMMRTDPAGTATMDLPIIVPTEPMVLRVVAGMAASPATTEADLSLQASLGPNGDQPAVRLSPPLLWRRTTGQQPLWVTAIEVPAFAKDDLRVLRLELRGPPGTELRIQTMEISPP